MEIADQLDHLSRTLLDPVGTSFPDPLSESERALVNAYIVLAHAVLEERLEDVFREHVDRLLAWRDDDLVPVDLVRLAFAMCENVATKQWPSYRDRSVLASMWGIGRVEFAKQLSANNGLKSEHVERLAKLTGVQWVDLEDSLTSELADLDLLGAKRGAAGHLSPFTTRSSVLTISMYPDDVRGWVEAGTKAVLGIERFLRGELSRHQPKSLILDWDGN